MPDGYELRATIELNLMPYEVYRAVHSSCIGAQSCRGCRARMPGGILDTCPFCGLKPLPPDAASTTIVTTGTCAGCGARIMIRAGDRSFPTTVCGFLMPSAVTTLLQQDDDTI